MTRSEFLMMCCNKTINDDNTDWVADKLVSVGVLQPDKKVVRKWLWAFKNCGDWNASSSFYTEKEWAVFKQNYPKSFKIESVYIDVEE